MLGSLVRRAVASVTRSTFPGASTPFTSKLSFRSTHPEFPCFRVMNEKAEPIEDAQVPDIPKDSLIKMYKNILTLNVLDNVCYDAQRQGRITFYMTHYGEEAILTGSAAALSQEDMVFGQYREAGVILWRGFSIEQLLHQLTSSGKDLGKGRQMPVHVGSREHNFQTISSPLATQIPQAAGSAYAYKHLLKQQPNSSKRIAVAYFGEGAASEGDFHAALNFAATLDCPVMFICRNNGYAISTPSTEQYRGDGIATRGPAYGISTIRVDGNDIFAVYAATRAAREEALKGKPVLLEMMTYRVGHHSTSDDSTKYRTAEEIDSWRKDVGPGTRLRKYLEGKGWWSAAEEEETRGALRTRVVEALTAAEKTKKSPLSEIFTDVYDKKIPILVKQEQQLKDHLAKYGSKYTLEAHMKD